MKNILVTGAGGFIGSHLCETLVRLGINVRAFIRYNSMSNIGWLENSIYKKEIEIVKGDIRDYDSVYKALEKRDTVFHLAALIGIPYSYISPMAYIKTNIEGTYNVLQSTLNRSLENIIITSTSETYGTAQYVPIDENHPLVGQSPYSATKISADQLAISFFRSFGLPMKIVRPFNTYGPRQSTRAIIPTIITQILKSPKNIQVGNIEATRDFTYVLDTVRGFIEIASSSKIKGEIVNVGMNTEISIKELIELIAIKLNKEVSIKLDPKRIRPTNSEVERLKCNNDKLLKNTNWKPEYNIDKGIDATIEWVKDNINLYKQEAYNV